MNYWMGIYYVERLYDCMLKSLALDLVFIRSSTSISC